MLAGYSVVGNYVNIPKSDYTRLKKNFRNYKSLKLHVGCGPRILKDWVNIDLSYASPEKHGKIYPKDALGKKNDLYILDVTRGLPLPDNCVDVIFHEDFIEHLDQKEQFLFLAEMRRILKKGHTHRISTPNILASMKKYSKFNLGAGGVYTPEWEYHIHKNILSPILLKEMAEMVGYKKATLTLKNQSRAKNLLPAEYRPSGERRELKDGNVFIDLVK